MFIESKAVRRIRSIKKNPKYQENPKCLENSEYRGIHRNYSVHDDKGYTTYAVPPGQMVSSARTQTNANTNLCIIAGVSVVTLETNDTYLRTHAFTVCTNETERLCRRRV